MLLGGDSYVGGGQYQVETRPRGPAVDRGDDRLPNLGIVVAQTAVGPGLGPVDRPGERPEDVLGPDPVKVFLRHAGRWGQVMSGAEVPVARAGEDSDADIPVLPDVLPDLADLVGRLVVKDVALVGIVDILAKP